MECKVFRNTVIGWAVEAYLDIAEANGGRMLTTSELERIVQIIRDRSMQAPPKLALVADDPHEPGKIIDPVAAGGAGSVPGKTYPKATKRKSSN